MHQIKKVALPHTPSFMPDDPAPRILRRTREMNRPRGSLWPFWPQDSCALRCEENRSQASPIFFDSRICFTSSELNCPEFCMVMFISPQHAPAGGPLAHPSLQAHLVSDNSPAPTSIGRCARIGNHGNLASPHHEFRPAAHLQAPPGARRRRSTRPRHHEPCHLQNSL